ncbi:MAG: Hint domain-containing protein [Pseudomonadota bacterium]
MPTVSYIATSAVSFTDGTNLGGRGAQGGGNHLANKTLVLSSNTLNSIEVTDTNTTFQDDVGANQTVASGPNAGSNIEAEFFITVRGEDRTVYDLFAVSLGHPNIIGLAVVGDTLPPTGEELVVIANGEPRNFPGGALEYDDLLPVCFTPGTLIRTPRGMRAIETLEIGDEVVTRDNGVEGVRWISRSSLSAAYLRANRDLAPVVIAESSIAPGLPARDLRVSPCHRVLITGWRAEVLFGAREVLVTARSLINDKTVRPESDIRDTTYIHLLFDAHQIVESDGLATESYRPLEGAVDALSAATQDELFRIMPQLRTSGPDGGYAPARRLLKDREALALR